MEPGKHIGDYEMIRPLGVGGMAEVWLARHPRMNRQFAIKFILDQFATNHEIEGRFHDEAWRQSMLESRNIVRVNTVITVDGRDYIIMEYVESGLDKRLHELGGKPLPLPEAVNVQLQLLEALEYAHRLPEGALIHRDIKPSNILLTADGIVKLTDFGIALATNEARKTMTGQALGTAFYMSPEQIVSPSAVDARTDIYSAGCVLYEMLTGRPPFGKDGDTDYFIQHLHMNQAPEPLRRSNQTIPENFEWIVMKALAKDPAKRFQTCREFAVALLGAYRAAGLPADQLKGYQGGLTSPPLDTTGKTPPPLGVKPGPPPPPVVVPPVVVPPFVPPGSNPYVAPFRTTGPQVVPPVPRPWYTWPWVYVLGIGLVAILAGGIWYATRPAAPPEIVSDNVILRLEGATTVGEDLAPQLATEFFKQQLHATNVTSHTMTSFENAGSAPGTLMVQGTVNGETQTIAITSDNSTDGFKALAAGHADLAMSSRPYQTASLFASADPPVLSYMPSSRQYQHVIAYDGIGVIVNNSNTLSRLTISQLSDIYTGTIKDWSAVGGSGGRIHCYGRDTSSGTYEMFRRATVGIFGQLNAVSLTDQLASGKDVIEKVKGDPNGIGFVSWPEAAGVKLIALSKDGTDYYLPSQYTVATDKYAIIRQLYLYQPKDPSATSAAFTKFVRGPQGQAIVHALKFNDLNPEVPAP
jgi:serine/threonine protein kinase/ABC-type phosphate transport system substrate-binding protein